MKDRFARRELDLAHIQKGVAAIKADLKSVRDEIGARIQLDLSARLSTNTVREAMGGRL